MGESLTYAMYNAMAIKQDFNDRFFPFDPDDLAALLRRKEEILEALDESEQVVSQIGQELERIGAKVKSDDECARFKEALAIAWAQTSAEGYHRTAEYHRRLLILREL